MTYLNESVKVEREVHHGNIVQVYFSKRDFFEKFG